MIPTRDGLRRTTLITFLILLLAVGFPVFVMARPYALTLLMAAILAIICDRPYRRLRTRGWSRHWAAGLTTTGLVLLVLAPIALFTWAALQQAVALGAIVSEVEMLDVRGHVERLRAWGPASRLPIEPDELEEQLRTGVGRAGAWATGLVLSGVAQVPSILLHGALAVLACFFFLSDGKRLVAWLGGKLPLPPQILEVLQHSFKRSAVAVVLASMAAASAQAVVTLLTFGLLGVPAAFVAAGVTFVFAWVPFLGVAPVYLVGITGMLVAGHPVKALLLFLGGCLAGLVDNVVRPAVLGGQEQLHPMTSLVAIFGGIATFGLFGAFSGPVLVAV
ncbi:MAG: AI-2E family transporter, partial [Myxococcota bacterium]